MAALAMTDQFAAASARRLERARLLDELRNAETSTEARETCGLLLLAADPALDTLKVYKLVQACKGVGPSRARRILRDAQVSGDRQIGDLLARDAIRLGKVLRGEVAA